MATSKAAWANKLTYLIERKKTSRNARRDAGKGLTTKDLRRFREIRKRHDMQLARATFPVRPVSQ
ncbi:hypothetical protein D0B32_23420 [Paraburkholderia sp. DHOC27]|nr:hypothetical protein D0B32_23420 [Paraburkholderia sp. DHOC27]